MSAVAAIFLILLLILLLHHLRTKSNRTEATRIYDEKSQEVPQDAIQDSNTEAAESSSDNDRLVQEDSSEDSIYDNFELYRL